MWIAAMMTDRRARPHVALLPARCSTYVTMPSRDAVGASMQAISAYHALYFDEVAAAVEFCDRLVSFVVPRAGGRPHAAGNPAVWFHVPPRSTRTTREGCYLFLSPGAVAAAEAAGIATAGDVSG